MISVPQISVLWPGTLLSPSHIPIPCLIINTCIHPNTTQLSNIVCILHCGTEYLLLIPLGWNMWRSSACSPSMPLIWVPDSQCPPPNQIPHSCPCSSPQAGYRNFLYNASISPPKSHKTTWHCIHDLFSEDWWHKWSTLEIWPCFANFILRLLLYRKGSCSHNIPVRRSRVRERGVETVRWEHEDFKRGFVLRWDTHER